MQHICPLERRRRRAPRYLTLGFLVLALAAFSPAHAQEDPDSEEDDSAVVQSVPPPAGAALPPAPRPRTTTPRKQAPAQPAKSLENGERITLNLQEADLGAVINTVAELTGKNFIVDPRVKGRVTVVSSRPLDADEVYQVFLSVLNVHGFAVVPGKAASKIVPVVNAKQDAIPTVTAKAPGKGDEYVTRVIQVDNVAVPQLVPILRPLLSQQAHLAAYPPSNVLIASGEAAVVDRIVKLIERIDITGDAEMEIITLSHAAAPEVVKILQSLQKAVEKDQPPVGQPTIVADERTNSILISGGPSQRLRLRGIIAQLDTPLDSGGNTEVIYLRYANAADMATVLSGISGSLVGKDGKPAGQAAGANGATIQADEATNALVISAAPDVMRSLKAVIRRLDVRRAQVLVEGVIAEVSSTKSKELGVQWAYFNPKTNAPVGIINFGGSGVGIGNLALSAATGTPPTLPDGALLGVGDVTERSNGQFTGFAAFVRALAGDGDTNILSTPSVVTLDNEEAEIVVGQNVPFITGSYASTGTGTTPTNPFQTIQRQDVGLTLRVRPQINEGSAVRLEVEQEVSSISAGASGAADIITNKRSLKTSVMVDNGQVVVLGGLIDDDLQESDQRVPILGDIPVLGWLFSHKRTTKVKRNLMVFLRPVILRDETQNAAVSGEKYNYIRARQQEVRENGVALMRDDVSPLLPELNEMLVLPPPFQEPFGEGAEETEPAQ
ncbi:MAG: type II secretion system secretin GspD [Thiohalomonadaceae bacterium]